ncbi:MAG: hypothetical protein ACYCOO_04695 [Chitinophagaceae bacterium]
MKTLKLISLSSMGMLIASMAFSQVNLGLSNAANVNAASRVNAVAATNAASNAINASTNAVSASTNAVSASTHAAVNTAGSVALKSGEDADHTSTSFRAHSRRFERRMRRVRPHGRVRVDSRTRVKGSANSDHANAGSSGNTSATLKAGNDDHANFHSSSHSSMSVDKTKMEERGDRASARAKAHAHQAMMAANRARYRAEHHVKTSIRNASNTQVQTKTSASVKSQTQVKSGNQ